MKYIRSFNLSILAILFFNLIIVCQTNNQIEGRVVDENNIPVSNTYVELYNDVNLLVGKTRSSSQGRFTFRGLPSGRYIVQIKPYGTNLLEAMERVEIYQSLGSTPVFEYIDVKLEVDRRFTKQTETIIGTIYAQEVPDEARRLYESGAKKLKSGNEKGISDIEQAIKIFPSYFDALNLLGREYVKQNKYSQGYPLLLRAIDVNSRCPDCYYSLAVAFYKLNEMEASIRAAKAAVLLMPNSGDTHLLLGILLRITNNFIESEKILLEAEKLLKDSNPDVHRQLALLYNNSNRNKEASDELEKYLQKKTDITSEEKRATLELIRKLRKNQ